MTAGTWPPEGLLPPLPEDCYPPGAETLPVAFTKTLLELRPPFTTDLGDAIAIGFDEAMELARERAAERGHRQIVTRCYDDATRIAHPPLARFWCVQDWR